MKALMPNFQAAGFSDQFLRLAAAQEKLNTMTDGFASLAGPGNKELFQLVPQPLKLPLSCSPSLRPMGSGLKRSKGYTSCVASVLSCTGKGEAFQVRIMSDMISSMELEKPKPTLVLPEYYIGS